MSSLMQFNGKVDRRGVHLQAYLMAKDPEQTWSLGKEVETYVCPTCGREHSYIYIFIRKPKGMFGPWVVFRWNGEDHVPDLSCPMYLYKIPKDAKRLSEEESSKIWHS